MVKGNLKLQPQHPHWYEDLPERDAPVDRKPKMVHGDINAMDGTYLEVSRASSLMRGFGVILGVVGVPLGLVGVFFFILMLISPPFEGDEFIYFVFLAPFALGGLIWGSCLALKVDVAIPRDRPIRFNRILRKVYVYEHIRGMNPFVKWPIKVKEFDWDTLHAEMHRYAGFTGKVYIQRFALYLVSCKPGTNEVMDRFELKGNMPTNAELYNAWAYCRHYMEQGVDGLPVYSPKRQEISFRRSLFEYMRFLDPTEEGREERALMTMSDWTFNVPFFALTFWLFIPMGAFHYMAMRLAPEAKWPPEVDVESRSA